MNERWEGPLRRVLPGLVRRWEPLSLACLPTPVRRLSRLGLRVGHEQLYVKCDHDTSGLYGGNKVRKLEFLLAEARRRQVSTLVTIGGTGSNHVLATTLHGRGLGLRTVGVVFPQPDSPWVQRNQAAGRGAGLELVRASSRFRFPFKVARTLWSQSRKSSESFLWIPGGGSSALGVLGFVNAGLELADQVRTGLVPEPACVFVAMGTGGTAAGLALGLRLGGLKSRVKAVRVVDRWLATRALLRWLERGVGRMARTVGEHGVLASRSQLPVDLVHGYFGEGYGYPTEAAEQVLALFAEDGISLETTYTGKAAAAFVDEARRNPKPLLFWNTVSAVDLNPWILKGEMMVDGSGSCA